MASKKDKQTVSGEQMRLDPETQGRLNKAGYVPLGGGGDIHKWEVGLRVEGQFCGVKPGKMGFLFSVQTEPGVVEVWGCPKGLKPLIEDLSLGTDIFVECIGMKPSDYKNEMYVFQVYARASGKSNG